MARRGQNIYKRKDGRWEGRYVKGKKSNGKPFFGYVYGRSYNQTKDKLLPLKYYYLSQNTDIVSFSGTLMDWTKYWMNEVVKSKIKGSTYSYYNSMLQTHILPRFGDMKLVNITNQDIQLFAEELQKKRLTANTIHNVIGMLNRLCKGAVKKNVLLVNPCTDVELPNRIPIQIDAMSKNDQEILEKVAIADKDGLIIMLALYTGMRIGEICGLQWNDIDFYNETIHVQRTIQRIKDTSGEEGTKLIFGTPKSMRSNRIIPLPKKLINLLKEEKKKADGEYIISCKGSYAEPRTVRYRYKRIINKANIKPIHFHGLRHTFSTRCLEMKMDIAVISRILGHSSIKMTMDVYLDATLEHKTKSIQMLDHLYEYKSADLSKNNELSRD